MLQIFKAGLLVVSLLVGSSVSANVSENSVTARGSGFSPDEAVANAIANAAGQAFGVKIQALTETTAVAVDAGSASSGDESAYLNLINQQVSKSVNSPDNKPIIGYQVNFVEEGIAGSWDAEVLLRYAQFEKLGPESNRRSVIVVTPQQDSRVLLTSTVEEALVDSRRFDVLDRDNQAIFEAEKVFIQSDDADGLQLARLGNAAGTDYLVITSLQDMTIINNQREVIRLTGEVLVQSSVRGTMKLEVVEFASRKVKWSDTTTFGKTYRGVSRVTDAQLGQLFRGAADSLVDGMVDAIFPMRVVKVIGSVAIINRGAGILNKGDELNVYMMGEELIDPQSGESLGALEMEIGPGTIVDVKPKFSYLRMNAGALDPGIDYIVRQDTGAIDPIAEAQKAEAAEKARKAAAASARKAEQARQDSFLNR